MMSPGTEKTGPPDWTDRRSFIVSLLAAGLAVAPSARAANRQDYRQSMSHIEDIFMRSFFDPAWMMTPQARLLFSDLMIAAGSISDPDQFCRSFDQSFQRLGLSHVALSVQRRSAAQLGRYFDTMEVGSDAIDLTWYDTVACLTVHTFMGQDTGPRIMTAFQELATNDAMGLIIDLRDNPGGAFAMRNLVGHCLSGEVDAGMFLGRRWYAETDLVPDRAQIEALIPWQGTSVVDLWRHLATHPITRVQFLPLRPTYRGPIAILINGRTQSAAELVAELLRSTRGARLVGEPSAGAMLVQRPFDVGDQFTLSLPVADYISHGSGRIEGSGLVPDINARTQDARSVAQSMLSEMSPIGGNAEDPE